MRRRPPGSTRTDTPLPTRRPSDLQYTEEAVRDPRALALAAKVGYGIDPDNEYPANYTGHIRAELTDGRVVEERQGQLRGGTREPMSRDDLLAKAGANLAFAGRPAGAAEALADFATGLFDAGGTLDRKSVGSGKSVSVSVDLGGRRIIKQKTKPTHEYFETKK